MPQNRYRGPLNEARLIGGASRARKPDRRPVVLTGAGRASGLRGGFELRLDNFY